MVGTDGRDHSLPDGMVYGLLKPYMASAVTGLEADYQLHQVHFLLAFFMITMVQAP